MSRSMNNEMNDQPIASHLWQQVERFQAQYSMSWHDDDSQGTWRLFYRPHIMHELDHRRLISRINNAMREKLDG